MWDIRGSGSAVTVHAYRLNFISQLLSNNHSLEWVHTSRVHCLASTISADKMHCLRSRASDGADEELRMNIINNADETIRFAIYFQLAICTGAFIQHFRNEINSVPASKVINHIVNK